MKFCDKCNSLLYTKYTTDIGDGEEKGNDRKLSYYCKLCCENSDCGLNEDDHTIFKSEYQIDNLSKTDTILKYAKYDYTLPRLDIPCKNKTCKRVDDGAPKKYGDCIIFIRYNNDNLSNIYLCPKCESTWKNESN